MLAPRHHIVSRIEILPEGLDQAVGRPDDHMIVGKVKIDIIIPFVNGRLVNPFSALLTLTALESVRGVTVNEITTEPKRIAWHQQNTFAVVESMEGAPLHYVCLQAGIPFLQLRSVSNAVGVRDKTKWDIPLAIARLNKELIALLEKLENQIKHDILPWI